MDLVFYIEGYTEWREPLTDWPIVPIIGDKIAVDLECECGERHEFVVTERAFDTEAPDSGRQGRYMWLNLSDVPACFKKAAVPA